MQSLVVFKYADFAYLTFFIIVFDNHNWGIWSNTHVKQQLLYRVSDLLEHNCYDLNYW